MENNKKRKNSLFALEQKLFGNKNSPQQSHKPAKKKRKAKPKKTREQGRAYDVGEAIELQYNSPTSPSTIPEAISFSAPNSFPSELEDESLPFTVEAFEVDEDVEPISQPATPQVQTELEPEVQPETTSEQMEAQPVETTVVSPSEMLSKPTRSVKQPTTVESSTSKAELSDDRAFAEDLQAVLNGQKTYDAEEKPTVPTSSPTPPSVSPAHPHDIFDKGKATIPSEQPTEPEPVPISRSHAVFDQMGQNMARATDFDQGTMDLSLEQSFDEFDRILDKQAQEMKVQATPSNDHDSNQEEEETLTANEMSEPLARDTSELPSDRNLMTQALETKKSPTKAKTSSPSKESEKPIASKQEDDLDEDDWELMIPPEVWF